ncbi:hypothetical protein [Flavobacterium psychraquaticum]|uniref:hypothetical protein n=1 Tax=Flavobacterium psychraquaticum TaxID=3103958 RepID=UPI002ACDA53C|nr:hypothetical protein [Flavobacterium sp. LB-N7T]
MGFNPFKNEMINKFRFQKFNDVKQSIEMDFNPFKNEMINKFGFQKFNDEQ